jgi:ABC-2 type transport system ATP-binding protein
MIDVQQITKLYGQFLAVSNISFKAEAGDIVGFLGPNGAGKTTTIRMLSTFLPPTSGTAKIAGFDIIEQADEVRKRIGYLPENPPLYDEMKVVEYLKFIAQIKGVPSNNVRSRIEDVVERCFLTNVTNKLCRQLSRGYRQRVGLAQAIIHDPAVVILDEPTSGLDPKQIIDIRETIKSLRQNRTVIFSTHILPEVQAVCNKVVIINRGRIVRSDSLQDLMQQGSLEQVFMESIALEQHN